MSTQKSKQKTEETVVKEKSLLDCCIEETEKQAANGCAPAITRKVELELATVQWCCGVRHLGTPVKISAEVAPDGTLVVKGVEGEGLLELRDADNDRHYVAIKGKIT